MNPQVLLNNYLSSIIWTANKLQSLGPTAQWTLAHLSVLKRIGDTLDTILDELEKNDE